MRVAVVFSGQIRGNYKANIERMRSIIPNADFFFTAWEDQRKLDTAGIVNRFYKEPIEGYLIGSVGKREVIKRNLKILRKIKNKELSENHKPVRWRGRSEQKIIDELWAPYLAKKKASHSMKQMVAHALAVRDFCDAKDYDIIIRCRYDIIIDPSLKSHIKHFCEQTYKYWAPHGFHCFNSEETFANMVKPKKIVQNCEGKDLRDFIIIHRADLFDPNRVFYMFDRKILMPAELGWWQTLCQPYMLNGIDVRGYVNIELQHQNNRKKFEEHRANIHSLVDAPKPFSIEMRYNCEETMNEVSDDVGSIPL